MSTGIQWTDETWNPVTGCTKVSQGCKNCYAETIADRFFAKQYPPNLDGSLRKFTDVRCHFERLEQPFRWKKPRRVFVNSMSDLFHEDVPFAFIQEVWNVMSLTPRHSYQVLTKRAERMREFLPVMTNFPQKNIWLGVSVESPLHFDRIAHLQQVPAAIRFLSLEPLLQPVAPVPLHGIGWVIVGGESGQQARHCEPEWIADVVEQCHTAHVPCFVKQMGTDYSRWKDGKGGNPQEWPEYLRVREWPI